MAGRPLCRHLSKEDIQIPIKHMKRCSTPLIIREIQIKTIMRCHLTQVRMAIFKKSTNNECWVEKRVPSYTVGGNINQYSHCEEYGDDFSSVAQSCLTLCDLMDCSTPGLPVHHQLSELAPTHVLRVGDAFQPSHPLSSPSPPALNLSQHQGLFRWVSSSHQVAKVLEFQLQHQSFQRTPRIDFL